MNSGKDFFTITCNTNKPLQVKRTAQLFFDLVLLFGSKRVLMIPNTNNMLVKFSILDITE